MVRAGWLSVIAKNLDWDRDQGLKPMDLNRWLETKNKRQVPSIAI